MAPDLAFVLYRSEARRALTEKTVVDILSASIRNNSREGLTGFLHTDRNCFLQYIEGAPGPLRRKVAQIAADKRHTRFEILAEGTLDRRFFPDWDMGQIRLAGNDLFGLVRERRWLRRDIEIDPVPLIRAFAAHAGFTHDVDIDAA